MGLLIFLLAYLLQDQIVIPVLMDGFFSFPVMRNAQIYLETVYFAVSPVGSEVNVMILYQLFPVVPVLEHAEIALLTALVLKDTLLFLYPLFHSQLSTMIGSSYSDLRKLIEYPLFRISSRHSSKVFLRIAKFVGLPVFASKIRTTYLSGYSFGFL